MHTIRQHKRALPPFFSPRDPKASHRWCLSEDVQHLHATSLQGRQSKGICNQLAGSIKWPERCRCPICTYAMLSRLVSTSRMSLLAIRESCSFKDCTEQSTDSLAGRGGQRNSALLQLNGRCLFSSLCLKSHTAAMERCSLVHQKFTPAFVVSDVHVSVQSGDRYEEQPGFLHIRESSKTYSRKIHAGESPWATSVPATSSQARCCVLRAASSVSWADKWESKYALAIELYETGGESLEVLPMECVSRFSFQGPYCLPLITAHLSAIHVQSGYDLPLGKSLCPTTTRVQESEEMAAKQIGQAESWNIPQQKHRDTHKPQGATKQPQQHH